MAEGNGMVERAAKVLESYVHGAEREIAMEVLAAVFDTGDAEMVYLIKRAIDYSELEPEVPDIHETYAVNSIAALKASSQGVSGS